MTAIVMGQRGLLYDFETPFLAEIVVCDSPKISVSSTKCFYVWRPFRILVKFCLHSRQNITSAANYWPNVVAVAGHGCEKQPALDMMHGELSLKSLTFGPSLYENRK